MRTFISIVFLLSMLSSMPIGGQAATHHAVRLAPADEYFGRQKMSILEIGNRLRELSVRSRFRSANVSDMQHIAEMTMDAMQDWQQKYPGDPWLRKDRAALTRLYKIWRR